MVFGKTHFTTENYIKTYISYILDELEQLMNFFLAKLAILLVQTNPKTA